VGGADAKACGVAVVVTACKLVAPTNRPPQTTILVNVERVFILTIMTLKRAKRYRANGGTS
jgi:hypothetical protein